MRWHRDCIGDEPVDSCPTCTRKHQGCGYRAFADEHCRTIDRLAWDNVSRIVAGWLDRHPLSSMPFRVLGQDFIEVGFDYPLHDAGLCSNCGHDADLHDGDSGPCTVCTCAECVTFIFCGRLDGVIEMQGSIYVLEHKTTGDISPSWLGQYTMDSQLTGYIWAATQHTGRSVVGALLNAVEFSKLPTSERKCPRHATSYAECGHLHAKDVMVTVTRDPVQFADWKLTALHLARRFWDLKRRFPGLEQIVRVRQQGMFNQSCRYCGFADWCRMGRPLDYPERNLVVEPWTPWERVTLTRAHTGRLP